MLESRTQCRDHCIRTRRLALGDNAADLQHGRVHLAIGFIPVAFTHQRHDGDKTQVSDKKQLEWYKYEYNYPKEVIDEFKKGVELLKKAQVYAQRIDWLLSGDDGEESFLQRLKDDLNKLEQK